MVLFILRGLQYNVCAKNEKLIEIVEKDILICGL